MSGRRFERVADAAGIAFPVVLLAGLLLQALAFGGAEEETSAEVVARYSDNGNELLVEVGALLVGFAIAAVLPWVANLHATLRAAEGSRSPFAHAALAGGIVMASLLAAATTASAAAFSSYDFFDAYETDSSTVLLMQSVSFYLLGFALVGSGVLVGATSIVALRSALLPRWLAIVGLVLAAILVFGEWALFFTFPLPAFLLWVVVVTVVLRWRDAGRASIASCT